MEKRQNAFMLLCGLLISFCLQIIKFEIFPQKYFYDAGTVQEMMKHLPNITPGSSFGVTAWIFHKLDKIFPMNSQLVGGITIWMLAILPCGWIVMRYMRAVWSDYILYALYCVLLPVFVWNTLKEAVQFFFFFIVALCAIKGSTRSYTADSLIVILLAFWGLLFRNYYLVVAIGVFVLMLLYYFPYEKMSKQKVKRLIVVAVAGIVGILIAIKCLQPQLFVQIFGIRTAVNWYRIGSPDAKTIIQDPFSNKNGLIILYLLNYVSAAVRMLFPFELILKGVQYIPYIGVQILWDVLLLRQIVRIIQCRKKNYDCNTQMRLLTVVISFYLVLFLFEPDFGSFMRHQTAAFPVVFPICASAKE